MKLINVLNARSVITSKAQVKGVNFKTSFKFMKFLKATDEDEKFYNEKREELITTFATKDEDGKIVIENNQDKFTDEELDKMEFTIEEVSAIYELIKEEE